MPFFHKAASAMCNNKPNHQYSQFRGKNKGKKSDKTDFTHFYGKYLKN